MANADQAQKALSWKESFLSLWAPITVFGLVLLCYIGLIEAHTPAYRWAQPALKGFGLVMLGYFLVLLGLRLGEARFRKLRKLRHEARELVKQVQDVLAKRGAALDDKTKKRLEEQLGATSTARLGSDVARLETEYNRLAEASEKHLARWRPNPTAAFVSGIAKALLIAFAIRSFFIEPYRIPSSSMIPTLEIGDQIFISKFIYGIRIPYLNKVPFVIVREPKRGDVIVFENPINPSVDLVKRVIGIPGDKIELRGKQLYLNGVEQPTRTTDARFVIHDRDEHTSEWFTIDAIRFEETVDGQAHSILHIPAKPAIPEHFEADVPAGHVLVLGDDRDNSADSRYGLGDLRLGTQFVPYGRIKGKAMVVWLCLGWDGLFSGLFGGTGFRTDRLFTPVR